MKRYRDCIFDLYGTLVDIRTDEERPALWQQMIREFELRDAGGEEWTAEELRSRYHRLVQAEEEQIAGSADFPEISLEKVFGELLEEEPDSLEVQKFGHRFRELSTDFVRLYPGAGEMLQRLKCSGRRVWLLSNAQTLFTRPELAALGIADHFDGIYISSEHGMKKPDAGFFRILLEEQGIDPACGIMIGNDGTCDIAGARAVGLSTLYLRSDISPKEPFPEADHILEEPDMDRVREILLQEN